VSLKPNNELFELVTAENLGMCYEREGFCAPSCFIEAWMSRPMAASQRYWRLQIIPLHL